MDGTLSFWYEAAKCKLSAQKGGRNLMNRLIWAPALCLALVAAGIVRAAPQIDADPNREYPVTPEAGPWMICAAHFNGVSAPQLAHQLVLLIRSQHNTPAYVFNYADEERKKQKAVLDKQAPSFITQEAAPGEIVVPIPRHRLTIRVEEQCAVMIGGYPDEKTAHEALLAVKKLDPPDLKVPEGAPAPFASVVDDQGKAAYLNPFSSQSMVVRNPSIPHATHAMQAKDDPFLKTLNADEEYSMLRCPGKWTLAVREYVGASMVENKPTGWGPLQSIFGPGKGKTGESLALAANNAHELAKTLTQLKFDAYVLHTRTSSVVSIGAFNDPNDPVMQKYRDRIDQMRNRNANAQTNPSKKDPLGLFPTLMPVEAPHFR
ncbi:MAG TPA: hypothetical protein DDY78_12400 [Planctomycetales bacterium]|jgi:hypothetical protein|nr:hypothetical protein [Planctomycetales bacterium]